MSLIRIQKIKKSYYCDYTYDMLLYLCMHVFPLLYLERHLLSKSVNNVCLIYLFMFSVTEPTYICTKITDDYSYEISENRC